MQYLSSRREGLFDWIVFHRPKRHDQQEIAARLGLDPRKPVIGLLTNVTWDAQLHYPANAFPNMLEWLVQTCEYFGTRPDLQLLIRVHPAEISGFPQSRQPILVELRKRLPRLAPNIFVVPPESDMSTYVLMSLCNAAIIYSTKMGVELTSVGLPVIVAGEAWIRNKGLTHDASSPEEYFRLLERLPFPERLGAGAAGACAPLRVSLLLQPHDSAAVHRAEGRLPHLSPQARQAGATPARTVAGTRYNLRRDSRAGRRSSCATRAVKAPDLVPS